MNLRQIEAFRSVMRLGSMTAAAEALYTSQPNVSRLIAQLELSTGLKLFERAGVRLIPTKEGSAFFQEVERAYVGLDSLRQSAKNIRNLGTGRLRIAAVPSTGLTLIPQVIKHFVETHPELTVSLHMNASPTVVQWVQSQFCDLGVVVQPSDAGPLETLLITQLRAVCVLPPGHRLAVRELITAQDLHGENFVSLCHGDGTREQMDKVFENAGVERKLVVEGQYSAINCEMVASGMGAALVSPNVAQDFLHKGITIHRFEPELLFPVYVVTPAASGQTPLARQFIQALREHYETEFLR
ncbi:LysR substrate-binding domain-containing protein [Pseudomonas luteola]|uniref:LysR substrate-binding domain-containing protein n=1 Tax=Pseudomonas luteola TaxID=47886 RepID=UPI00123C63C9|nr:MULTISPECIES: LysR substrate-binding domain-containing protein [Pseudomonas]MBA1246226.1 LysR family transcriptional regulator [Pseudomonas zeshuii]QEU26930.1 LysR family transcriptional regulator [Pseudomonas luteola]